MPGWGAEENKHRRFRRIQKAPELKCVVDGQSSNCAAILPFEHAMNTGLKSFPSPPFHGALCWSCCVPWALVFTLLLVLCFALLWCESGERLRVKCSPGLNYHLRSVITQSWLPRAACLLSCLPDMQRYQRRSRQFKDTHRARAHDANIPPEAFKKNCICITGASRYAVLICVNIPGSFVRFAFA